MPVSSGPVATALVLTAQIALAGATLAETVSIPSMVAAGPFGDPLLLLPNASGLPRLPLVRSDRAPGSRSASRPSLTAVQGTGGGTKSMPARDLDEDDDEEEDAPTRPGRLPTSFPKLPDPSPLAKRRSLGPHLSPDLSYDATDRASFGVIGNSARLDGRTTSSFTSPTASSRLGASTIGAKASAAPTSASKSRDVGLGLSFQYRFGQ